MRIDGVREDMAVMKAGIVRGYNRINMGYMEDLDMMSYMKGLGSFLPFKP